jgi:hypothetical protein
MLSGDRMAFFLPDFSVQQQNRGGVFIRITSALPIFSQIISV